MKVRPSLDWLLALVPVAIGMRAYFIMAISFFFVEHL